MVLLWLMIFEVVVLMVSREAGSAFGEARQLDKATPAPRCDFACQTVNGMGENAYCIG